jgi:serine/threonine-protein kinase
VREGYVANTVNHAGVVSVLDDDLDETGSPFLVMELLEGVSVEALYATRREPIPVREALGIALQLLEVLEAAHENTIVHRDIKPANLFLQKDGQLKVLDFGIARLRETDQNLQSTKTGAMLGTPAFMSPEQALAEPGDIDARTDLWAVGATLFTLLSARFVHEGDNARQLMIRAATEPARALDGIVADLPAAVVELVARALRFEKAERWQTATEMRLALVETHRTLFGEPERSHLATLAERVAEQLSAAPTEASGRVNDDPNARLAPAASVTRSLVHEDRGIVTTTATPVSTASERVRAPSAPKVAFTGALLLLGGGIVAAALFKGGGDEPSRTEAAAAAAPTTSVSLSEAKERMRPSGSEREPVADTPASRATASVERTAPSADGPARRPPPSAKPVPGARPVATAHTSASASTANPSATATASTVELPKGRAPNPLQLELQ